MKTTVVVPLHNESPNLEQLFRELRDAASTDERIEQIVFVDDGSTDDTYDKLTSLAADSTDVVVLRLRRNFGQTAAMSAGFAEASGDVIIPMDGDLQNDPADIPHLLDAIEEGYDVVSGWRKPRMDPWLTRRLPSWFGNRLISLVTGLRLHDYGCSLKAYRSEVLHGIRLYGEMHRFIPCVASWMGIEVKEIPVKHRPRRAGKSKYGLSRFFRVILDLINVKFFLSYGTSPIQAFGRLGLISFGLSFLAGIATILMKIFRGEDMTGNPIFMLCILLALIGMQFISIGILGEISMRTYYESQDKPTYVIRERFQGGRQT